ncbi:phosphate acyltransferase PlsX [Enhygromyxa salina]|nr:phosphate acyltransferase PlsX [Enhygromyxa salina]
MSEGRRLKVALDAFGSDRRPDPEVEAALLAAKDGLALELVGDRAVLDAKLAERGSDRAGLEIVHAPSQISMDASAARAVRAQPDASLCVAVDRLAAREVDAVVSAGNSGALLAAALLRLGRCVGLDRPAIATSLPRADQLDDPAGRTVLLDAGANVECKVLNLVQFAVVGAAYSRIEYGVARPRVAVLANGRESVKGTALTRGAHGILSGHPSDSFEFVGYVEPNELFSARCDVAVTDGWTGNVALKLAEGAMAAWPRMLRAALAEIGSKAPDTEGEAAIAAAIDAGLQLVARHLDPEAHGGAPLLGVDGAVMICHGAAGPRAILNAVIAARRFAERGLTEAIGDALEDHTELFELARKLP